MSVTLKQLITEAQEMALRKAPTPSAASFWQALGDKQLQESDLERIYSELLYFHSRFVEFASVSLHVSERPEAFAILSSHFVSLSSLKLETLQKQASDIPSPAVEALCNLMLYLAETDRYSYLTALAILPKYGWRFPELVPALTVEGASPEAKKTESLLFAALGDDQAALKCSDYLNPVSEVDRKRVLGQVFLMLETADLIFAEWAEQFVKAGVDV